MKKVFFLSQLHFIVFFLCEYTRGWEKKELIVIPKSKKSNNGKKVGCKHPSKYIQSQYYMDFFIIIFTL